MLFIISTLNTENFKLKIASYDTLTLYLTKIEEIKDENGFSSRRIPRSDLDFQKIREHLTSDRCGYFSDPEFKKRSRGFEYSFGRLFLFCKQTVPS
ncbi:hypothetical protein LEP1GSC018_3626 [Leptospira kirschneri str. 2008720114]|nr:hypothetical protein LEP1GSC018_3626 [Leptospira kirschneri str. 2008720114]